MIKSLQEYLQEYGGMIMQPISEVIIQSLNKYASSDLLAPSGNGKTVIDIVGNKTFENNYVFYASEAAVDEVDHQGNHDFLEEFIDWLDERNDIEHLPELPGRYIAESIEVTNAMLYNIDEDGTGLYQIQVKLTVKKGKE